MLVDVEFSEGACSDYGAGAFDEGCTVIDVEGLELPAEP